MMTVEYKAGLILNDAYSGEDFLILFFCLCAAILLSQLYIARYMYQQEQSWWWALVGGLLPFGLNIYLYQIFKFEKQIGYNFDHVPPQQRRSWRVMYTLALSQFMLMFVLIGWLTSP
ncbi:hypothetical protein [Paenibacillus assamensis]|uniref:hypothetical protein n=1 Tax=Paenibacillus assamensis TaxID=311244 RepID=UPI000688A72E|nr:hypothetical protein [Paenibacillus assamensis]